MDHDESVLREPGAYDDGGDPYIFTPHRRLWDHVDLIMPPGEPKTWEMGVFRDGSTLPAAIAFDMFTERIKPEAPSRAPAMIRSDATNPTMMSFLFCTEISCVRRSGSGGALTIYH